MTTSLTGGVCKVSNQVNPKSDNGDCFLKVHISLTPIRFGEDIDSLAKGSTSSLPEPTCSDQEVIISDKLFSPEETISQTLRKSKEEPQKFIDEESQLTKSTKLQTESRLRVLVERAVRLSSVSFPRHEYIFSLLTLLEVSQDHLVLMCHLNAEIALKVNSQPL